MTTLGTTRHVAGPAAVANSHDVLSLRQAHEVAHEAEHRLRHAVPRHAAAAVHTYPHYGVSRDLRCAEQRPQHPP